MATKISRTTQYNPSLYLSLVTIIEVILVVFFVLLVAGSLSFSISGLSSARQLSRARDTSAVLPSLLAFLGVEQALYSTAKKSASSETKGASRKRYLARRWTDTQPLWPSEIIDRFIFHPITISLPLLRNAVAVAITVIEFYVCLVQGPCLFRQLHWRLWPLPRPP
jgi:hypothetical protein